MLNLVSPHLPLTIIMKAISTAHHLSVVSLLNQGYSHCQIQAKTGLGKGTVGRSAKEVEKNKENNPGGCPSKLSTCDKAAIIWEIHSGRVDNAVQATQFINSTISKSVTPQTIRNVLKESGFYSATKKKFPCLRRHIENKGYTLQNIIKTGLWRIGKGSCGLMKQRLIELGQMGRYMYERRAGNSFLIKLQVQQSSMEGRITWWCGVVWAEMGWGSW